MVIRRIAHLAHRGIFHNYRWSHDLYEFGRYNLIYGWNGTGKTTLSRVFQDLELRSHLSPDTVSLSIDGLVLDGADFHDSDLPIRVFNRDLVDQTILPLDGSEAPPILVLGKESVERQENINTLKLELADCRAKLQDHQRRQEKATKELDKYCIASGRTIKRQLKVVGTSYYMYYDKRKYQSVVDRLLKRPDTDEFLLEHNKHNKHSSLIHTSHMQPAKQLILGVQDVNKIVISANRIMSKLVHTPGSLLDTESELVTWLHDGLRLCQEESLVKCPFCEQALPNERIKFLEREFSSEFRDFQSLIDDVLHQTKEAINSIDQVISYDSASLYSEISHKWDKLKGSAAKAKSLLYTLTKDLERKRFRMSIKMRFERRYQSDRYRSIWQSSCPH